MRVKTRYTSGGLAARLGCLLILCWYFLWRLFFTLPLDRSVVEIVLVCC